jgi:bacillithiol biosynthesis cysteine-adding enzyme BshC
MNSRGSYSPNSSIEPEQSFGASPTTNERDVARQATLTELQVITEPLGGSPLSLVAQAGDGPRRWYPKRPESAAEWRARVEQVAGSGDGSDWATALAPALQATGAAAERVAAAASGRGVVITTGQQPGLFGGPVYTFSKAMTALALADELEARTGLPVAPVFWAATDDADFEEARWTKVAVTGRVERLEIEGAPPVGTPMSEVVLGDLTRQIDALGQASGSAAFAEALAAVREAYRTGATVGSAFVTLLRALLEPLGVAVLDASHLAVRRCASQVLRQALRRAPGISAALEIRANELRAAGFEPQVADAPELSLVFAVRGGVKQRVPVLEAQALARSATDDMLSPNVLLRPVVERAVLPTVAYAAGPAELAYFAQVSAVAEELGADAPLAVPRWSCTIIEPHVQRVLERLGTDYTALRDGDALEGKLARAALPGSVTRTLDRLRDAIDDASATLSADAESASLVPNPAVAGARSAILRRLQRLERRYVAAVKRREGDLMRDVATVRAHLYPDRVRQERGLNLIPTLARQGPGLWGTMRDAATVHARSLIDGSRP